MDEQQPPTEATPPAPTPNPKAWRAPTGADDAERVKDQVARQAGVAQPAEGGGGHLLNEPILVVNQKAKLIELTNEYDVFDQHGTKVGMVCEVGQSTVKKALRLVSSLDQFMTHRLEIRDADGTVVLGLTRPAKFMKSKFVVTNGAGAEIGGIKQKNMMGKKRFALEAGGKDVGMIHAENWRSWDFRIEDANGNEVARIKKTFEGFAKAMFTTADNYVLQFSAPVEEPLKSLIVTAALCIDTALKQDSGGGLN
jgi:uncharacterized protein YxjI